VLSKKGLIVLICASLVLVLSMGMRQSFGLFQSPINEAFGLGFTVFSLSLAIQILLWGLSQPFIGALSDRYGSGRVIATAGIFQVLGLLMLANADSMWGLHVSTGIVLGISGSGSTWAVMLSVVARHVPEERRTLYFGIASSMGTAGQILIAPLNQFTINTFGYVDALIILAVMLGLIVPLAFALRGKATDTSAGTAAAQSLYDALNKARKHSGYLLLISGFYVCGFHVMFVMGHLPNYLITQEMPGWLPGAAISTIGVTNLAGTLIFGWLGDKYSKKYLLSILYTLRSVVIAGFIIVPLSPASTLVFSFCLGFLWLATVPLTNGLVGQMFGIRYLATLAGIVFASHQLGSFTSLYLGGWLFDTTGSYDLVWQIAIALGIISALIHLPIKIHPKGEPLPQPAQ